MNGLRLFGLFLCVMVVLSVWGCLPEPGDYGDFDEPSEEYRMKEVERKLEMLQRNENW